jgi:hypothetical protein
VLAATEVLVPRGTASVRRLARLAPHIVVLGLYAGVKSVGMPLRTLPPSYPYHVSLQPSVIWTGIDLYARWFAHALAPLDGEATRLAIPAILGCAAVAWNHLKKRERWTDGGVRLTMFAAIWAACGLIPVLPLVNHRYDYYLTYSWAPLAFLTVRGAEALLSLVTTNRRIIACGLASWIAIAIWSNVAVFTEREGSEKMLPMAYPVELAIELPRTVSHLPRNATLVLEDINVSAFGRSFGPRVWFDDDTIEVYGVDEVRCFNDRMRANYRETAERVLDDEHTLWLRAVNGRLIQQDYGALRRALCR